MRDGGDDRSRVTQPVCRRGSPARLLRPGVLTRETCQGEPSVAVAEEASRVKPSRACAYQWAELGTDRFRVDAYGADAAWEAEETSDDEICDLRSG